MAQSSDNKNNYVSGDKVRVRSGEHTGERGIVQEEKGEYLVVQLGSGDNVELPPSQVTNYSLAARRAWQVMPKRTGRPKSDVPRKKMVSMRLDIETWERLGLAVEMGLINSREEAVNLWLRERLDALIDKQNKKSSSLEIEGNIDDEKA
jgi:hypothetical protein